MPLKELLRSLRLPVLLWLPSLPFLSHGSDLVSSRFSVNTGFQPSTDLLRHKNVHALATGLTPGITPPPPPRDLLACGWAGSLGGEDRVCESTTQPATPELGHNEGYLDYLCAKHLFRAIPNTPDQMQLSVIVVYTYGATGSQEHEHLRYLKTRVAYIPELPQDE